MEEILFFPNRAGTAVQKYRFISKTGFAFCLAASCLLLSGCNLFESHKRPRIEETPEYYQNDEFAAMRSFHERDREKMASQVRIVRNKELDKLHREVEEQKKDQAWEEDYQRTLERREKMSFWKKFSSAGEKDYLMSDKAKRINNNLETGKE